MWSQKRSKISFGKWRRQSEPLTEVNLPWNGKNIIRYTWFHLTFFTSLRCCFSAVNCFASLLYFSGDSSRDYKLGQRGNVAKWKWFSSHSFLVYHSAIKHWMCNQLSVGVLLRSLAIKLQGISIFLFWLTPWLEIYRSEALGPRKTLLHRTMYHQLAPIIIWLYEDIKIN